MLQPAGALAPGDIVWVAPEIAVGREQTGRRPALVMADAGYVQTVDTLPLVVPITIASLAGPYYKMRVSRSMQDQDRLAAPLLPDNRAPASGGALLSARSGCPPLTIGSRAAR
ncbi:MAG: type II toxin-antitoxin system PemK/MazF family toxin [Solirubrobacteraceae bacterium]